MVIRLDYLKVDCYLHEEVPLARKLLNVWVVEMIDRRLTLSSLLTIYAKTIKDVVSESTLLHRRRNFSVYSGLDYRRKISFGFY